MNQAIKASQVRLIDAEGEQLGVVSINDALKMSEEAGLDLIEVSPEANPPVCKIVNYGKYKYQLDKRKSAAKKHQKKIDTKEIKLRPATEEGDYQVKLRNIIKFLAQGDKAKVTMRFRGREMSHPELGMQFLERMIIDTANCATIEQHPKFEGRQIVMVLGPKKK